MLDRAVLGSTRFTHASTRDIQAALRSRASNPTASQVVLGFVNPHVISQAEASSEIRAFLERCSSVCVDGIGTSIVLRLRGVAAERIPAHRLLDELLDGDLLRGNGLVLGIESEHLPAAIAAMEARAPSLSVVSSPHGFAADSEVYAELGKHQEIDVVLIGAGSPRSEWIANRAADAYPGAVIFVCGAGSLLALAGHRKNAPPMVSRLGIDWLYRFVFEPHTRRRYTIGALSYARALVRPVHPVALS